MRHVRGVFNLVLIVLALGTPGLSLAAEAQGPSAHSGDNGAHEEDAQGHDGHHVPHFSDINWIYGFLGEKEDVSPSLLWRPPGTPIPLGALILNTAILFFLIGRLGGPGIRQGLAGRKARIAGDIERAAKMRAEAEEQLAHYEEKLTQMEAEMVRIKVEMKEQAEADRARILREAKERRTHLEAGARLMIEQELANARHDTTVKAVSLAMRAAREQIEKALQADDHERLSADLIASIESKLQSRGAER